MAAVLDQMYGGPFWGKFYLVLCDPADQARIDAGKAAVSKVELDYLIATGGRKAACNLSEADRKWNPAHLPQKLQFEKGYKLPDFLHSFPGCNNKFISSKLVSSRLKELIEQHRSEADDWQFYPVDILGKDGTLYATYYAWCVARVLDGIDETSEGIKSVSGPVDGNHLWQEVGKRSPARLKLKKSIVGGLNAWTDSRFHSSAYFFISDALLQAMSDAEITGFAAHSIWSEV